MEANRTPLFDGSDSPTGCCPRFHPEGWDGQALRFADKLFVRARTRSLFHVPMDMGPVFADTFAAIQAAGAEDPAQTLILSRDLSPWSAEHLFAVSKPVPGREMVRLSGDYRTQVFEGPYKDAPKWADAMKASLAAGGQSPARTYFFYTTCPKCSKTYGRNYVVAVAELARMAAA